MLHGNINKSTVKKHKRHTQMNKSSTKYIKSHDYNANTIAPQYAIQQVAANLQI
jgi:hypothetical protein